MATKKKQEDCIKKKKQEDCINAILKQNNVSKETQEISDDDDDDDNDDDDEKEDDIQEGRLSFVKSLAMLDKINKCCFLDDKSLQILSTVTR